MPIPAGWSAVYGIATHSTLGNVTNVCAICPNCRKASTFRTDAQDFVHNSNEVEVRLILSCNYSECKKSMFVFTVVQVVNGVVKQKDVFFMHPSTAIDLPHISVPAQIADDWTEAQKAMAANAPKAAAVMFRRVLYSVMMDKGIKKLRPINEAVKNLIQNERLPAMFDEWLPAISEDGHDGAHPDRALEVDTQNIAETMEYTSELLRYLYIEPYEFQQRKNRKLGTTP